MKFDDLGQVKLSNCAWPQGYFIEFFGYVIITNQIKIFIQSIAWSNENNHRFWETRFSLFI